MPLKTGRINVPETLKTAWNAIAAKYDEYSVAVNALATFTIPTVAASTLLTPWAAVPVAVTSGIAAIGVADRHAPSMILAAVFCGAVAGMTSFMTQEELDPGIGIPGSVKAEVNAACWEKGKTFDVPFQGKKYAVTIGDITNETPATPDGPPAHHSASVSVTYPYHTFLTGALKTSAASFTTVRRPGAWDRTGGLAVKNGEAIKLNCP